MKMNSLNTHDRLREYYPFSEGVLDTIATTAEEQNKYSFAELADRYGISNGTTKLHTKYELRPIEALHFTPTGDYDEKHALVAHMSMGKGITPHMAMNAIRLFGADSSQQLIVIGNPSTPFSNSGRMSFIDSATTMIGKSLDDAVRPTVDYVRSLGITNTDHYGYSYGADKAAATMGYKDHRYEQHVGRAILIEPVSAEKQSLSSLVERFKPIGQHQQRYIEQTASETYMELFGTENRLAKAANVAGLLRLSNIAIAKALAHGGFDKRLRKALDKNPDSVITTAWGTESELSDNDILGDVMDCVQDDYGKTRVKTMRLQGMHHVGGYDIDLHAAIVLQGLKS